MHTQDPELNRILKRILMRVLALRLSAGAVALAAVSGWVFLLVVLWTAFSSEPPLWAALTVAWGTVALLAFLFIFFVVIPVVRMPGTERLASEIEHRKDFKDLLMAAYEFSRSDEAARRYNPHLVRAVIDRAVAAIAPLNTRLLFLGGKQLAFIPLAYGGVIVILLLTALAPGLVLEAGGRILDPRAAAAPAREANIFATPGDVTVLAGSDVEVAGRDFGRAAQPVRVHFSRSDDFWKSEPAQRDSVASGDEWIPRYTYRFRGLRSSVAYFFQSGDAKSPVYHITVVHKPIVTGLRIVRTPPPYTREPADTLIDNGGNIQALEGTRIAVSGTSNNPLAAVTAHFSASADMGDTRPLAAAFSGGEFSFEFTAARDEFYSILLEDSAGYRTDDPLVHTIAVYTDNPPSLDVLEPGGDAVLPRSQQVPVSFLAADDYGIAETAIYYRIGGGSDFAKTVIDLDTQRGRKEVATRFVWDLGNLTLFPGNSVEYYLQVTDNNSATGPGRTKSRLYQLRVPTMAELYDGITEDSAERGDMLAESLKEGEEFKSRIEKLSREFAKTRNLDWSQKKELDTAIEEQRQVQDKLDEVRSSLDRTLQELSDNQMTSQAIGEKMEQISKLLEEINDSALNKYIEDLQKAVATLTPEEIEKSLRNLKISAEDLLKKLERTASLLEAVRKEQQMEDLVRSSRELAEKQKELLDRTKETASNDRSALGELAREQRELAEQAGGMKERIERMKQQLNRYEREIASRLDASSQRLAQKSVANKMSKASDNLEAGQKSEAMQNQQEALEELISLFTSMSNCQANMGQMNQMRLALNLQKYAREALDVSFKQEELLDDLGGATGSGGGIATARELAERQQSYLKATERIADDIFEIGKETMAVSPVLLHELGVALQAMRSVLFNLDQNRALYSLPQASSALEALNRSAIEMLRASKSCSSGSGCGMGMQELLQQLLAGQQEILQQSQEMLAMQMIQEQMRMKQQARMRRLAAAQRSLKELAEEIAKQLQEDKSSPGRMDRILEDMAAVVKDLDDSALSERTLDHQERILSRLLDAQRSIHNRDYERKRESVTADDIFSRGLGETGAGGSVSELREEIRRAMKLKAPGEYEDLIRYYFRALAGEYPAR